MTRAITTIQLVDYSNFDIPILVNSMPYLIAPTTITTWTRRSYQLLPKLSRSHINPVQIRGLRMYREKTVRAMYWRSRSFDAIKLPEKRRDAFQDWNYRSEIFAFSRRLQENLSEDTLRQVFAHPAYIYQLRLKEAKLDLPNSNLKSNEELVTRGNQLLTECIKPYLRFTFTRVPEEGIRVMYDYLVSESVLADVAKWIGCKELTLTTEWPPSQSTMANTVKSLVAGIERDLGLKRVRRFCVDIILTYLNDKDILDDVWIIKNPKEMLNLILENNQLPPYEPRIVFQTGVRTIESCHIVGLYTNQKFLGSSPGETISVAEECAALDALQRLFDLTDYRAPYVYGEASELIDYEAHKKEHAAVREWRYAH